MLCASEKEIPKDPGWSFSPKFDGARCIAAICRNSLSLTSRNQRDLTRYFPEVVKDLERIAETFPGTMLDGELVIVDDKKRTDFERLLSRIHPAEKRVRELSASYPACFISFDVVWFAGTDLRREAYSVRRQRFEELRPFLSNRFQITPMTDDRKAALKWFRQARRWGCEGVVARRLKQSYLSGKRAMLKIRNKETIDCVVAGYSRSGALLLGLYKRGRFIYVGQTTNRAVPAIDISERMASLKVDRAQFETAWIPDGLHEWLRGKDTHWIPVRKQLVCEVLFDHLNENRFRHMVRFSRWRMDKDPRECQLSQPGSSS